MPKLMSPSERMRSVNIDGVEKTYKAGYSFQEYMGWLSHLPQFKGEQPIVGDFLSDYINRPDTRRALNIPSSVQGWSMCSDEVGNNWQYQLEGSLWIYQVLMQHNYKILFYSGDTDGAVPTWGTKQWLETLNLSVKEAWRSWSINGQVSGYLLRYNGLDFATVHGVGHMAPQWAR